MIRPVTMIAGTVVLKAIDLFPFWFYLGGLFATLCVLAVDIITDTRAWRMSFRSQRTVESGQQALPTVRNQSKLVPDGTPGTASCSLASVLPPMFRLCKCPVGTLSSGATEGVSTSARAAGQKQAELLTSQDGHRAKD